MNARNTTKKQFKEIYSIYRNSIRKNNTDIIAQCERIFSNDFGMSFSKGDYAFNQLSTYGVKWFWLFKKDGYAGWRFNRIMDLPNVEFS